MAPVCLEGGCVYYSRSLGRQTNSVAPPNNSELATQILRSCALASKTARRMRRMTRIHAVMYLARAWQREHWESWVDKFHERRQRQLLQMTFIAWGQEAFVLPPGLVDSSDSE